MNERVVHYFHDRLLFALAASPVTASSELQPCGPVNYVSSLFSRSNLSAIVQNIQCCGGDVTASPCVDLSLYASGQLVLYGYATVSLVEGTQSGACKYQEPKREQASTENC